MHLQYELMYECKIWNSQFSSLSNYSNWVIWCHRLDSKQSHGMFAQITCSLFPIVDYFLRTNSSLGRAHWAFISPTLPTPLHSLWICTWINFYQLRARTTQKLKPTIHQSVCLSKQSFGKIFSATRLHYPYDSWSKTLSGPLCPSSSPATLYGWGVPS